jgi:hypothetical protein
MYSLLLLVDISRVSPQIKHIGRESQVFLIKL